MARLSKHKTGFAVGSFLGLFHLAWARGVASGKAQSLLEWIFSLHFLVTSFTVQPFQPFTAGLLVAFAYFAGYLWGWAFAAVWNVFHEDESVVK